MVTTTPTLFLLGFSLGAATVWLFDFVDEFSPSTPPFPPGGGGRDRRRLKTSRRRRRARGEVALGEERTVRVGSMCRCPTGFLPVPGPPTPGGERDTGVVQPPSLATGATGKRFLMNPGECACAPGSKRRPAPTTTDPFLKAMRPHDCPRLHESGYDWGTMPDLGVEEDLPLFVGVLSYKSPLSLKATLFNWLDHDFFHRIKAREVFVRLNARSEQDHLVVRRFAQAHHRNGGGRRSLFSILGSPEENLHPGLAIADFCRRAESHPDGHPNGENLLMFLEKDWNLLGGDNDLARPGVLEGLFRGINALAQRGVNYVHLKKKSIEVSSEKTWPCPSQGFPFECTTSQQHRWSNQPMVVRCDWFLRYLEPFALLDDPIMHGCREGFQEKGYCDWEEALQDGRVAWSEAQWVVANLVHGNHRLFFHQEVDG